MEELRRIMSELVDIEYSLEAFSSLLEDLDEIYESRHHNEQKEIVWLFKVIVYSLLENLGERISEIDRFILDNRKDIITEIMQIDNIDC